MRTDLTSAAVAAERRVLRRLDRRYATVYTPQQYGAVGDGVADDTAYLLEWLDAVIAAGDRASGHLPSGIYRVTAPLERRDSGTALTITGEGARQSMIFGDFVGAGDAILDLSNENATSYSTGGHRVSGLGFLGRGTPGDPIGLQLLNAYECVVDDIDAPANVVVGGNGGLPLANSVIVVTNDNNSKFTNIRSQGGWQPFAFDTAEATASFTSGSAVVTASASVFTAGMAGRTIYFASGSDTGSNAIWSATISTYDSPTQVTLTSTAPSTASGVRFVVGHVTGTTAVGSTTLTLNGAVGLSTAVYAGMQVHVFGASDKTDAGANGVLSTRVVSVSGSNVTLEQPATVAASNTEVLFAPALFIGSFEGDPSGRQTNHSWWRNVHLEGFAAAGLVVNRCIYLNIDNLKVHGAPYSTAVDWGTCYYPAVFSEVKSASVRGIQMAYGIFGYKMRVSGSRGILTFDNVEVGNVVKNVEPFRIGTVNDEFRLVLGDVLFTYPFTAFSSTFDIVSVSSVSKGFLVESRGSVTHRTKNATWTKRPAVVAPGMTGQHNALAIANDTAVAFRPPGTWGTLRVSSNSVGVWGDVHYRTSTDPAGALTTAMVVGANTAVAASPLILTGTTGAVGKLTISAGSDGLLYIENRRGFTVRAGAICSPFGY